jgi:ankyrin repeat protein
MKAHSLVSPGQRVHGIAKVAGRLLSVFALICTLDAEALAAPNDDILAAAKAGDRSGVEAALASGASVNARGDYDATPLMLAAIYGHANVAALLLDRGANLNARSALGQTPITIAAQNGNVDVAKLLLGRGADVNSRDAMDATPLHWAALSGQKKVASLLLARGAMVNAQDFDGKTPLHYAASAGETDMISLLIARGTDLNLRNKEGQTPIQEAESSDLDAATKASVAAVLRAPARKSASARPIATAPTPAVAAPAPINTQAPNSLPACTDVVGIARLVMQANPGTDWTSGRNPAVLAIAVEKAQIAMGCRQAPQKTECSWIGSTWTCTTK